jgi:hypothetical protein
VGSGGAPDDSSDTTAPIVIDIKPADGDIGVSADDSIVITFSEPMDEAATESAYQSASAGITAASVAFSWNPDATVLTIKPSAALGYAEGTTLANVKARTYAFVLGNSAQDAAGNSLKSDVDVEFSTLRRITQQIPASAFPLSGGYVVKDEGETSMTYMDVGCLEANEVFRTFVTFELAGLPTDIEMFEMASVSFYQSSQSSGERTPYEVLGDLQLLSLAFTAVNRAAFDKLDLSGTIVVGKFSTVAKGNKSVTVTDTLAVDYETRDRSQYGVRFATKLNSGLYHDIVHFEDPTKPNPPVLETTYLVP